MYSNATLIRLSRCAMETAAVASIRCANRLADVRNFEETLSQMKNGAQAESTEASALGFDGAKGPLDGVRVLEMYARGPLSYAALLLAEYGAEVVRIVRPGQTDPDKLKYATLERSRGYIELDLKSEADRVALAALLGDADVLIEGFRPGVMERLGLGPDDCFKANPRIVYGRLTGWGQSGPLSRTAGHDLNFLALSGALSTFGARDREPAIPLNLVADYAGGSLFLVIGLLLALRVADATGRGQVIDAAMLDGVGALLTATAGFRARGDWVDRRQSNFLDGGAPFYRTYATSDGQYIVVGAIEPEFWHRLLTAVQASDLLERKQWDRTHWLSTADRLAEIFAAKTRDQWTDIFAVVDCCVSPVLSLAEAVSSPQASERKIYESDAGFPQPRSAPVLTYSPIRRYPSHEGATTAAALSRKWKRRATDSKPVV
jgi:alpha-methylacyl-CoA racemase